MNINHVMIVGRLTRDPEMKALQSGAKVTNFSLATSRSFARDDGGKTEQTEYHNIVVFGASAENCAKYLVKGQLAGVEGRLQTRSWDDKESGKKMYRTEIIAASVQFGPKSSGASQGASKGAEPVVDAETGQVTLPGSNMRAAVAPPGQKADPDQIEYPTDDINPDDIPF